MKHEIEALHLALSELDDAFSEKSRRLQERLSSLESAYHAKVWKESSFDTANKEIKALEASLKGAEQRYRSLQQEFKYFKSNQTEQVEDVRTLLPDAASSEAKPNPILADEAMEKALLSLRADKPVEKRVVVEQTVQEQKKVVKDPAQAEYMAYVERASAQKFQFESFITLLVSFLSPLQKLFANITILSNLYQYMVKTFKHYKAEGKIAVFMMTVSGILLLVTGFAYILQYSFVQLNVQWKLAICFIVSFAVVGTGIKLHIKRSSMQDYAAALIGLGMVLAYLCAYYMGAGLGLVEPLISFAMLAFLTVISFILAHLFHTKIVALVSLMGGACLPLLGETDALLSFAYPCYLLLLNISSLSLAYKTRWQTLGFIAFVLSAAMLQYHMVGMGEWAIGGMGSNLNTIVLTFTAHAFFYLYLVHSYYLLSTSAQAKATVLMAANFALFIALLPQILDVSSLGWCLSLNAAVLLAAFVRKWMQQDTVRSSMLMLQAAALLALAILSWVDERYMALMWGVEALLLLYMGLIFSLKSIRYEAYILMAVAMVHSVWQSMVWLTGGALSQVGLSIDWWMLLSIGLFLQACIALLLRFKSRLQPFEILRIGSLREAVSCWLLVSAMITFYLIFSRVELLLALPLMLLLFHRSFRLQLRFTEKLAWGLWLLPMLQIVLSASEADSFRFTMVDWLGKLAYIESFLLLWLVPALYKYYLPENERTNTIKSLRILFYLLIPVFFLPSIARHAAEWLPTALWGSAGLAYVLFKWKGMKQLYKEQMLLSYAAFGSVIALTMLNPQFNTLHLLSALVAGLLYYVTILVRFEGIRLRDKQHLYRPLFMATFYYAGLAAFLLGSEVFDSLAAGLCLLQLYIACVVWFFPYIQPLRSQLGYWYQAVLSMPLLVIAVVALGFEQGVATLLMWFAALLALIQIHMKLRHFSLLQTFRGSYAGKLVFSHLCLLSVYTLSLSLWYQDYFQAIWSVLLVLHATLMLFESLWSRFAVLVRVSVAVYIFTALKVLLYDLYDLMMIEKVIAFVLMGTVLLAAAYFFQRLKVSVLDKSGGDCEAIQ